MFKFQPTRRALPPETAKQRREAAQVTRAKIADARAWVAALDATRNAQKQNVRQGAKDAKRMLK